MATSSSRGEDAAVVGLAGCIGCGWLFYVGLIMAALLAVVVILWRVAF